MSARKVLVLGGTRFFGKRLVQLLLERGDEVTLATRGQTPDPFGERVRRVPLDRNDAASVRRALGPGGGWDVVFDQICYSSEEAQAAHQALDGRVGRYVLTSTLSVYFVGQELAPGIRGEDILEAGFDPARHPLRIQPRAAADYSEGKRQAEAYFRQRTSFDLAAARFPIVLGMDDYTGRLRWHIDRIRSGQPIVIPDPDAPRCFIEAGEAARLLLWLAETPSLRGPVNARSDRGVTFRQLTGWIERATGLKPDARPSGAEADESPMFWKDPVLMSTELARRHGFRFLDSHDWLPRLVDEMARAAPGA